MLPIAPPPTPSGTPSHIDTAQPRIDLQALVATLCELGRVERLSDLGTNGPLVASAGADSLYHCLFGRDSIRMAMDLVEDFPAVAQTTLVELARMQGIVDHDKREEEPGRILHEHRHPDDPLIHRLSDRLEFPYYGTVDATPQWVNLMAAYCERQGNLEPLQTPLVNLRWERIILRDSLIAALKWIERRLDDAAGGGYIWVRRKSEFGIENQVWEDSHDSHYFEDGTLFDTRLPYAPVAVQGYAYDALIHGAALLEHDPHVDAEWIQRLRQRAATLRGRVLAYFWQPDLGTFATALAPNPDGSMAPARVVASSPGHLLASRMLDGVEAAPFREKLIARLAEPDLLCAAGIRTKSTTAVRFLPGSYHNGSTWPMDTGVIADGLHRHGRFDQADDLDQRVLHACAVVGGFAEFFRGDSDATPSVNTETVDSYAEGFFNRLEQPPQDNQGWTATRVWRILRQRGTITLG